MPNLERVDFIGHSLGCRVTLETLLLLRTRTLPIVDRVVLMAAAIPSEMLEPDGKFYGLLMDLAAEGTSIRVLHSKQDPVLQYAFPPGQSLAGGKEASSRALGRFARPRNAGLSIDAYRARDYWCCARRLLGAHQNATFTRRDGGRGRFLSLGDIGRDVGIDETSELPPSRSRHAT